MLKRLKETSAVLSKLVQGMEYTCDDSRLTELGVMRLSIEGLEVI